MVNLLFIQQNPNNIALFTTSRRFSTSTLKTSTFRWQSHNLLRRMHNSRSFHSCDRLCRTNRQQTISSFHVKAEKCESVSRLISIELIFGYLIWIIFDLKVLKMISSTPRVLVNGAMLRNFSGQLVSIHVNVQPEAERNTTTIKAKSTDDLDITITLTEPLNAPVKGWIEVIGTPSGPNAIRNKEVFFSVSNHNFSLSWNYDFFPFSIHCADHNFSRRKRQRAIQQERIQSNGHILEQLSQHLLIRIIPHDMIPIKLNLKMFKTLIALNKRISS